MKKNDLVMKCSWLVSPTASGWLIEKDHVICISDGIIQAIEKAPSNWKSKFKSKAHLDLSSHIIIPGFVNAHTHLPMTLFRGLAEDMEFNEWLNEYILPIERELLNRDFVKVGAELAAWECISNGVTCVNDMYYFTDVVLEVLDKAGLRGYVAQTFMSFPTPDNKKQDAQDFKILERAIKKYKYHSRVRPAVGPHAPYTCTDELLKKTREFADLHDLHLHIHVSETKHEVDESIKQFGKSPVQRLYDLGVMKPNTSFAHGIHLSESDIKLIKKTKCGVIHNPESNMKITAGVCPVQNLLGSQIEVGLGTDGAASNNNLNMIQEMDTGAKLQKLYGRKIGAKEFLKMATLGSARALGLGNITGSIEIGKKADLAAIELNHAHMIPLHDPISQVVYSATGGEVSHVICDGKILMKDKKILTLKTNSIAKNVAKYQNSIQRFLSTRAKIKVSK